MNLNWINWAAYGNVVVGLLSICLQVVSYVIIGEDIVDFISSGLWGGLVFIFTSALILRRQKDSRESLLIFTVVSVLIGAWTVGLHAWSIDRLVTNFFDAGVFCADPPLSLLGHYCPRRVLVDSAFIVLGTLAVLLNVAMGLGVWFTSTPPSVLYVELRS